MLDFEIIDAHIHLIDRSRFGYSWSSGSTWATGSPKLNRNWTSDDLSSCAEPYRVEGFVFVEADVDMPQYLDEASWVEEIAASDERILATVACLPLEIGSAIEPEVERVAALSQVRGVRRLIQNFPDSSIIHQDKFVAALRLLPRYGLSFDVCIDHGQFPDALKMIRLCPDVSFVLDHAGKPDIRQNINEPWRAHIQELAALPNVVCKLSGMLTQADHATWTRDQVLPYVEHVLDGFGTDRVLFGGDWPVLELAASYADWVETVIHATREMSQLDKRKIFRNNAIRTYRLSC